MELPRDSNFSRHSAGILPHAGEARHTFKESLEEKGSGKLRPRLIILGSTEDRTVLMGRILSYAEIRFHEEEGTLATRDQTAYKSGFYEPCNILLALVSQTEFRGIR